MSPEEKRAIKEKMVEKGIDFDKAGEELKISGQLLSLYLTEDSNPVPKRIIEGLNKLLQE